MLTEAIEVVATSPENKYKKGVEAHFQKLNENWGIKFFYSESMRDTTYELQGLAHTHNLAPGLGEKFDAKTPKGDNVYGYITECVEFVMYDRYKANGDYVKFVDDQSEICDKLNKIMRARDLHMRNLGYMPDGRVVAIDFSDCWRLPE